MRELFGVIWIWDTGKEGSMVEGRAVARYADSASLGGGILNAFIFRFEMNCGRIMTPDGVDGELKHNENVMKLCMNISLTPLVEAVNGRMVCTLKPGTL
jgi:hypothetical protein